MTVSDTACNARVEIQRVSWHGEPRLVAARQGQRYAIDATLGDLLARGVMALHEAVDCAVERGCVVAGDAVLPPVDDQEIWGAGVTYEPSRHARVVESDYPDVYAGVYASTRPEIFFKAPGWRVPRPGAPLRLRRDGTSHVPEPELGVVATSSGEIAGYVVADDLTCRSIEAANPLFLPQAKTFTDAIALSSSLVLARDVDGFPAGREIALKVTRGSARVFFDTTSTDALTRPVGALLGNLFEELDHPRGVVLLTGTGIVPPPAFSLDAGDVVSISIECVGELEHSMYRQGHSDE